LDIVAHPEPLRFKSWSRRTTHRAEPAGGKQRAGALYELRLGGRNKKSSHDLLDIQIKAAPLWPWTACLPS
jgi:hypothetical protein